MKMICRISLMGAMAVGTAGLIGCDDTVSKTEETTVRSDGSTKTEKETVKVDGDGGVTKEKSVEKTPPTTP